MLTRIIQRGPVQAPMVQKTTTPTQRNAGTVSLIADQVQRELAQAVKDQTPGEYHLKVVVTDTGDVRRFIGGFLPEVKTL